MAWAKNPEVVNTGGDDAGELKFDMKEANSQSFKKGQFVYLNAGAVTACATNGQSIFGIAQVDATNVSSGNIEIPIAILKPDYRFKARFTNAGTDTLNSSATPGLHYDIYVASNICYVDLATATAEAVVYDEPILNPDGSATYWGIFHLLNAASQYAVGS